MKSRWLMSLSAFFMMLLGVATSFLPQEILTFYNSPPEAFPVLMLQACGGLYLGFAMLNWSARGNLIGGIYSRPVAIGNFLHFTIVAFGLLKLLIAGKLGGGLIGLTIIYIILAIWFGIVLFTHPISGKNKS